MGSSYDPLGNGDRIETPKMPASVIVVGSVRNPAAVDGPRSAVSLGGRRSVLGGQPSAVYGRRSALWPSRRPR